MPICLVPDCINEADLPGSARGLCRAHYRRWQRYGDEQEPSRRLQSYQGCECTEAGCHKPAVTNGLCVNHYAIIRRRNDPEGQKRRNLAFKERYRASQETAIGRPRPMVCELCGNPGYGVHGCKPAAGICFDHDHETGVPRGWLCDRCNKVLGLVRDSQDLLVKMAAYLAMGGFQHGSSSEKARVRSAVHRKFPEIGQSKD